MSVEALRWVGGIGVIGRFAPLACPRDRRALRKARTGIQYRSGNPVTLSVEGATRLPSRANQGLFTLIVPFGAGPSAHLCFYIKINVVDLVILDGS